MGHLDHPWFGLDIFKVVGDLVGDLMRFYLHTCGLTPSIWTYRGALELIPLPSISDLTKKKAAGNEIAAAHSEAWAG